ncbi:putative membrane protein [Paraburkholderia fungorum]|uniref:Membrane protein n=1 Tax=Paraburkholderia fungorum TaxID=134537 RepID=A0AAU8T4C7_9BURK|nr:hypothetical protein [Paraburkholderia fungorum]AJZ61338.1 putative membrane protein [Paraburkholderia fungorum]MBU7442397.1 hypothetical protein [Paraburkholderia fungorum]USU19623.1 hypothetical protein NFE55_36580 [Paraburkholderia fungorum]USU28382.1 hypothetical protein NFS19_24995 [Paraburkholderia fungorum]
MKIDVATFQTIWLILFLCSALITTALSRMFAQVGAFRFWAIGFYLLATATASFALHKIWPNDLLMLATATLALLSRILIWSGTRDLFGAAPRWRTGLAVTAVFAVLHGSMLALNAPLGARAFLLALFFLPCRAATLYEVCRRRRPHLGPARVLVVVGSIIAMLNVIVPLLLVLLDRANMTLFYGNPRTTSALYAVVFAGDLLLTVGLIVLALRQLVTERDMLATLDRGALEHLAGARQMRALRDSRLPRGDVLGHDTSTQRQSLPGAI